MAENIIIKYTADTSELRSATAELQNLGKAEQQVVSEFDRANAAYTKQGNMLRELAEKQVALNNARDRAREEPKILANINTQMDKLDAQMKAHLANSNAMSGLLGRLAVQERDLIAARQKSNDPRQIMNLTKEIIRLQNEQRILTGETNRTTQAFGSMSGAIRTVGTYIATQFAVSRVSEFANSIVTTKAKMEGLNTALEFSSRGKGEKALKSITDEADRLGLVLESDIEGFQRFSAAFAGTNTPIERQLQLYNDISLAVAAMKLPADKAANAFNALSQMVSKGKVQAEELRGQLGDALPGAFNLAAKAMGKNTAEFNKMLETGQVITSEFLPKFAAEIKRVYADQAVSSADSLTASLNRNQNAWLQLRLALGESLGGYKDFTDFTTLAIGGLAKLITGQHRSNEEMKALTQAGNILKLTGIALATAFLTLTVRGQALTATFTQLFVSSGRFASNMVLSVRTVGLMNTVMGTGRIAATAFSGALTAIGTAIKASGIGLLVTAVSALIIKLTQATAAEQALKEVNDDYNSKQIDYQANIAKETDLLQKLFAKLQDNNVKGKERAETIAKINEKYKDYLPFMITESTKADQLSKAYSVVNVKLAQFLELHAKAKIFQEYTERLTRTELELKQLTKEYNRSIAARSNWDRAMEGLGQVFTLGIYTSELEGVHDNMQANEAEAKRLREILDDLGKTPGIANLLLETDQLTDEFGKATVAGKHYADKTLEYLEMIARFRIENAKSFKAQQEAEVAEALSASEKRIAQAELEFSRGQIRDHKGLKAQQILDNLLFEERQNTQKKIADINLHFAQLSYENEIALAAHQNALLTESLTHRLKDGLILQQDYDLVSQKYKIKSYEKELDMLSQNYTSQLTLAGDNNILRQKLTEDYNKEKLHLETSINEATLALYKTQNEQLLAETQRGFQARQNVLNAGSSADQLQAVKEFYLMETEAMTTAFLREDAVEGQTQERRAARRKQYEQNLLALQTEAANKVLDATLAQFGMENQISFQHQRNLEKAWKDYYEELRRLAREAALQRLYDASPEFNKQAQALKNDRDAGLLSEAQYQKKLKALQDNFRTQDTQAARITLDEHRAILDKKLREGKISQENYNVEIKNIQDRERELGVVTEEGYSQRILQIDEAQKDQRLKQELQFAQERISIAQQMGNQLASIANDLAQRQQNINQANDNAAEHKYDKELAALARRQKVYDSIQDKTKAQEKAAQANATQTARIEKQRDDEAAAQHKKGVDELRRLAAFQKAINIANAIIGTAGAVVNALDNVPAPGNFAIAALAGLAGAAQIALIQATPLPAYAEGGEIPLGAGRPNMDSVLALLMPGERVMTKRANAEYGPTLKAIHAHDVSPSAINDFVLSNKLGYQVSNEDRRYLQGMGQPIIVGVQAPSDLVEAIRAMESSSMHVNFDKNGIAIYQEKQMATTRYYNTRYGGKK